jgi:hypothetical protein
MKLVINGFWSGFIDKTNPVHIDFFIDLFSNVFNTTVTLSDNNDGDILLENVFVENTMLFDFKWKYTFLFSGESKLNKYANFYSCVLGPVRTCENIINCPLFMVYLNCNNLNIDNSIPWASKKDKILAIISNGNSPERNKRLDELEKILPIDYAGSYRNNRSRITEQYNTPEFINECSKYKYIVSFENSLNCDTYITEKICHGLFSNSIPIYWGSNRISDYVNLNRIKLCGQRLDTIEDEKMILEQPFINEYKTIDIIKEIQSLLFRNITKLTNCIIICNELYEPERYTKLNNFPVIDPKCVNYFCPTWKTTISDEEIEHHRISNKVTRIRNLGIKKAELSLTLNYKKILERIVTRYSDGIFLILESDVYRCSSKDKMNNLIKTIYSNRGLIDCAHIGDVSDNLLTCLYNEFSTPYRGPIKAETPILMELEGHKLYRKMHTKCTDSLLWTMNGILKFLRWMNSDTDYSAPFDYYLTNFLELNKLNFRYYWSNEEHFKQMTNFDKSLSSIQNDIN